MEWILAAGASALFAGLTAILAKCGIRHTDPDVATAVRTVVVLALSWAMAAVAVGDVGAALAAVTPRSYAFLVLSGLSTGASWICYFAALAGGDVNRVVPIDKSSTALSALLAIVLFGETSHLAVKLVGTAVILLGTFMMVERREAAEGEGPRSRRWLPLAVLSALFAALTAVLAKAGVSDVNSSLATAVRTCVVAVMAWGIVAARGKLALVGGIGRRELAFLVASGVATGASWLFYYYAVQTGQVSVVVQIDKMSILFSVGFARAFFGERLSRSAAAGLALIVAGTLAMTVWS